MRVRLSAVLLTALTMTFGLLTLVALVAGEGTSGIATLMKRTPLPELVAFLLRLVVIITAVAVLAGVFNLLAVHVRRIRARRSMALYSVVMLASFILVLLFSVRPQADEARAALEDVQVGLELAFSSLVLFSLVYGAATLLSRRPRWTSALFLVAVAGGLVSSVFAAPNTVLGQLMDWVNVVLVDAGTRAILLGIGLATLVTGIRVLVGQDRATRE